MNVPLPIDPAEREALAGGYVLGALDPHERAAVAAALPTDADLAAAVAGWERRLSPLAELVEPVAPSGRLWERIAASTATAPPAAVVDLATVRDSRTAALEASVRRWRFASAGTGLALAASLAVIGFLGPAWLAAQRDTGRYVGIVNTGGAMPALVVSVDTRRGELKIRPLGIRPEPGKSHELWAVRGTAAPVSLGLVDAPGARGVGLPADFLADPALVLAVSVEPAGGSPTGKPTGPVVLTGKLIKED